MKLIIAIDPGASGGIAKMEMNTGVVTAMAMPEDADLRDMFENIKAEYGNDLVCYLEQVGGYIGVPQPGSYMFNFGDGFGYIRGIVDAMRIRRIMVRPQVWQKGIPGVVPKMKGAERKRALKEYAARLYPNEKVTLKTADALALLEYARRVEGLPPMPDPVTNVVYENNYRSDARAAVKWCKAKGHAVPQKNSKEFLTMVNYWGKEVRDAK